MLIQGKQVAQEILETIQEEIAKIQTRKPKLALLVVGDHAASLSYIRGKKKACEMVGMLSLVIELPKHV